MKKWTEIPPEEYKDNLALLDDDLLIFAVKDTVDRFGTDNPLFLSLAQECMNRINSYILEIEELQKRANFIAQNFTVVKNHEEQEGESENHGLA